ncbi:hypothetical protein [Salinimicrobium sediminilitoris]|uniref:hypothetical protein n=1 Tax=Salinimicrobium sediminilitoris TaxID=2876715 RepID=UPI001E5BDE11|nr:hypothetical protein [Salinimicrobium sediminilitoris]MCC8359669.1 hypothetical protein [Salinimicrobium sediminilitoris]
MKSKKISFGMLLLLVFAMGCSDSSGLDEDTSFLNTVNTENIDAIFDITNDNSGNVTITPTGEGVVKYTVVYGDNSEMDESVTLNPGESTTHSYEEGSYTVNVVAKNLAGEEVTAEFPLTMTYRAPENVVINTAGNMRVSASADYAESFLVYYGDVENEEGTPLAIDEELPPHTYPANGGPYTLRVVALSGGAATTEETKELFGLPITFERPGVAFFGTFDDWGQQAFEVVENPDPSGNNTSTTVGKYTNGHAPWSGTYSPLNIPIDFGQGQVITMMVYNPDPANIGKMFNMELEWAIGASEANPYGAVVKTPITTSGEWELLTFDFSDMESIPDDAMFTQMVFRFNDSAEGQQEVIFMDNITLTND